MDRDFHPNTWELQLASGVEPATIPPHRFVSPARFFFRYFRRARNVLNLACLDKGFLLWKLPAA